MKKGLMLFVLMIGLAGNVSAQTRMLKPTLQKLKSVPCAITLVYPNGGEAIVQGSRQTIRWKVTGTAPAIGVELLRHGKPFATIAKGYSGAKGKLVWTVGKVQPGDGYTIRLTSASNELFDASDQPFTISFPVTGKASSPGQKPLDLSKTPDTQLSKTQPRTATLQPQPKRQEPSPRLSQSQPAATRFFQGESRYAKGSGFFEPGKEETGSSWDNRPKPQQQETGQTGRKPTRWFETTGAKSEGSGSGQRWQQTLPQGSAQEPQDRSSSYQMDSEQRGDIVSRETPSLPSASTSARVGLPSVQQSETVPLTGVQDSGVTIEGAPPAQGSFVQRTVDLHFTSPERGEVWEKDRTYTIRWDKVGGIGNVKILLKDLMNQSSLWVSTGENHVIQNTGYYSFSVPANLPDSAFELQIMTTDDSYTSTSDKFYIGQTDTDLRVKGVNFGSRMTYIGAKAMPIVRNYYIVSELWLKNKGTRRLDAVTVTWKIVREPSARVVKQGEKTFENMTSDTWYKQDLKVLYFSTNGGGLGSLDPGELFVLILYADFDNSLGEIEFTRDDNTYKTEVINHDNYWGSNT